MQPAAGPRSTVTLFAQPYLDTYNECYRTIVTVNGMPKGPLAPFVRKIQAPPLSTFQVPGPCSRYDRCLLAIGGGVFGAMGCGGAGGCGADLVDANEIPALLGALMEAGYTIDTSVTRMLQQSGLTFDTNQGKRMVCLITFQE